MKIVIAGAGEIGFHLAKLLASEQHDIRLIDNNQEVLDYAQTHLDVITNLGDATSINTLRNANVGEAELFLGVTTSETSNIVASILSKKLGAKQTIARVTNEEYLYKGQKKTFRELGVDKIFSPIKLAVLEIERLLQLCEVTDSFEFEGGKITLLGITLDDSSSFVNKTIKEVDGDFANTKFRPIAILRNNDTIIPRSRTVFKRNDHVYLIVRKEDIKKTLNILGKELMKVKNVMIVGGTELGIQTARTLQKKYNVTIVEADRNKCKRMTALLDDALIIKGDPSNIELLMEEGLAEMDAFIALTPNSETNIITSLMAEEAGVFKTIASVDNAVYTHISQNIGVDTLINKKLIAANNIFRFVRKGQIEAITSIHGVDAEIIEYVVPPDNILTEKPLREVNFPKHALIGGVIRNNNSIIPDGSFELKEKDKVIIFAMASAISEVERLFLK